MASALDYAASLSRYQPQTQNAIRRSQYLQDALASLGESAKKDPQSLGEALARVGQTALLKRGQDKSTEALAAALAGERQAAAKPTLDWLDGFKAPEPAPQAPAQSAPPVTPAPPVVPVQQQPLQPVQPPAGGAPDGLWSRLIQQESGGNQAAVSPKGAFGRAQLMPGTAQDVANSLGDPSLAARARTDPETNEHLGRTYLNQMLQRYGGDHVAALAAYNAGPSRVDKWVAEFGRPGDVGPGEWIRRIPFPETRDYVTRVLASQSDAPGQAAPQPEQPALPMANPQPQAAPQMPPPQAQQPAPVRQPTEQQIAIARDLLNNPQTYDKGIAYVQQLRQEYAAPVKNDVQNINGVPTLIDPVTGAMRTLSIPQQAQSQIVNPADLGIAAAPGTVFQRSPTGDTKQVYAPPSGQQVASAPGGPYREAPIQGGTNDPMSPGNRLEAMQSFRGELKPIIEAATSLRRNIDAVRSGRRQQNGSGDIAITNGIQKLIDEGVVREGDVALQLKAQGIEGGIAGLMGMLRSDGLYSPQIRDRVAKTAEDLYSSLNSTYRQRAEGFRGVVEGDYGPGSFDRVLPPETAQALGWRDAPGVAAPGGLPAPNPAALQPPMPGAKRGQDGQWYAEDPSRKGSFPRVQKDDQGPFVVGADGQKYHWRP